MRILFLGDVVGKAGRSAVRQFLPKLRKELAPDAVLANAENAAGGLGLTCATADELLSAGADILTSGNHIWKHREIFSRLEKDHRLLRPANYPEGAPGRGCSVFTLKDGRRLAVLNLLGLTFMEPLACPFHMADTWVKELDGASSDMAGRSEGERECVRVRLVDFHAEATAEKKALGWLLDGRVSAVLGTHTHVQTADAQLLPKGTAYLTDLGMCGVEQSSLGMDFDVALERFMTRMPTGFKTAAGELSLNGAFLDIDDETGRARSIRLIRENCPSAQR